MMKRILILGVLLVTLLLAGCRSGGGGGGGDLTQSHVGDGFASVSSQALLMR